MWDRSPDLPRGIRPVLGPGRAALGPTGQSSGATGPGGGPIQAGAAIELPGVGGIDLARRLVELWGPVPDVVFISGSSCIGRDAVLLAQADVGGSGGR